MVTKASELPSGQSINVISGALGVVNNVTLTRPATGSTLTIANGKTLTASNTLTFTGTDSAVVACTTGGTVVYTNVATLSSLTSIGTIGTGVWQGTVITPVFGGTGVANNAASTITISGSFATTLTLSGVTSVTLPTSGTLASLSGANTWTAAQRSAFSTLTDGATITPDFSLSNNYVVTLGGNRTLGIPTNLVAGQTGVISVWQDITGSRTLAYAWMYVFPGGAAPTLSTGKLNFDQLYYSVNSSSSSTVTMTIAAPCVVTWTAHGLTSGQRIQLTTTGALPTGLTASTTYWVTVTGANTFNLSTSLANAQAGTLITTTGTQSGVHTATNGSITIANNLALA